MNETDEELNEAGRLMREAAITIEAQAKKITFLEGVRVQQRAMIEDLNASLQRKNDVIARMARILWKAKS